MRLKVYFYLLALLIGLLLALVFVVARQHPWFYYIEGFGILILLFVVWFYRKGVKPVYIIDNGLELLKEQDFGSRIRPVGQPEADRIVTVFNRMMEQLKEERLRVREQNMLLDLLINASPMGVILLSLDGEISSVNPAGRRFLSEEEVSDHPADKWVGKRLDELPGILAGGLARIPKGSVESLRTDNGNIYRCSHLSFMDHGFAHPFILIEQLTAEVMKAEKKAYEKVIRMIAHEVNNTTAGLTSSLDMMEQVLDGEKMEDLCEMMRVCSERCMSMSRFITRFADVVRIPEPQLKPADLNRCLNDCLRFMETAYRGRNIDICTEPAPYALTVMLDVVLFEQVMVNILKNATESMGAQQGEIRLKCGFTANGRPELVIANNGEPLSEEAATKLFTPFYSTRSNGQGLGLMFVREVLNAHGCAFSLKSYPDGWTRFRIRF